MDTQIRLMRTRANFSGSHPEQHSKRQTDRSNYYQRWQISHLMSITEPSVVGCLAPDLSILSESSITAFSRARLRWLEAVEEQRYKRLLGYLAHVICFASPARVRSRVL